QWRARVRGALKDVLSAARFIDPRWVRVVDGRAKHNNSKAQPLRLSPFVGEGGTDSATWWIDINDDDALDQLMFGTTKAFVCLPDAKALYERPGARWYRPYAPQLVLQGGGRSYRFGEDGRFEPDGTLKCRVGGDPMFAIYSSLGPPVLGSDLMANAATL